MAIAPRPREDGETGDSPRLDPQLHDILASLYRRFAAGEISERRYESARAAVLNAAERPTLTLETTTAETQPSERRSVAELDTLAAPSSLLRGSFEGVRPEGYSAKRWDEEMESSSPPPDAQPVPVALLLRGVFELPETSAAQASATTGLTQLSLQRSRGQISQSQFDGRQRRLLAGLPVVGDREEARAEALHSAVTELALLRAWGQISAADLRDGRTLLLGRGFDEGQRQGEVLHDDVRLPTPAARASTVANHDDDGAPSEGDVAVLALRRAWGQISHEEFVRRRSASLGRVLSISSPAPHAAALPIPSARGSAARAWMDRLRTLPKLDRLTSARVALQVALLSGVGLVGGTNMLHWPEFSFDEGTYVADAWAVQTHGALGFYTYTYGHPPLTWILMALWTWATSIFGSAIYSVDRERGFMLAVTIISAWLVYLLALRLGMRRVFAVAAVLLFTLSPIDIFFHRLVLLDNPATAWALAAFVLAMTPRRRLWALAGSGACFAAAVLCKETILLIFPALFVAAWQNTDRHTRRFSLTLFTGFFALSLLTYPLYAALKGELLPGPGHVSLIGSIVYQLYSRKGTGSIFTPDSVAHGTVMFWLSLDPWLLIGGLVIAPIALVRRRTRAVAVAYLIEILAMLRPGYLPNMYVTAMLPFAALIIAGTADALWTPLVRGWRFLRNEGRVRSDIAALGRWRGLAIKFSLVLAPVLAAGLLLSTGVAARGWAVTDGQALTLHVDGPNRAADAWLVAHVKHGQPLIVGDDAFWIYLIEHGFDSHPVKGGFYSRQVVSYWELDYDPAVKAYFPQGWRDFDYIVSTGAMRVTAVYTPNTAAALAHSRVVATFGHGPNRIEIRAIIKPPSP